MIFCIYFQILLLFLKQTNTSIDFLISSQKFQLTNDNKTLHIDNVTTDDSGLYSCKAINSIGESTMDFKLDVLPSNISNSNVNESYTDSGGDSNQFETSLMIPSGASIIIDCQINDEKPELPIVWMLISNATEILSNEMTLVRKLLDYTLNTRMDHFWDFLLR